MKKVMQILFVGFIVMSLFACGSEEKAANINELVSNVKTVSEYEDGTLVDNMETVKFGNYYLNNDKKKEPIEWLVLDKQDGKALLCSKYILDYKIINNEEINSYKNSNLRIWLNNDFYNNIFSEKEKDSILNEGDNVLLLEKTQCDKYFGMQKQDGSHWYNYKMATRGTEYAKSILQNGNKLNIYDGNNIIAIGNSGYFITDNDLIRFIDYEGAIPILGGDYGVRPIIWVKYEGVVREENIDKNALLEKQISETTQQVIKSAKEELATQINSTLVINDIDKRKDIENWESVKFGKYYINDSNIKEDIEWLVLEKNGNEVLLLSKYMLDEYWFDKYLEDCFYDTSELRTWLNGTFFREAFNEEEKSLISKKTVKFTDFKAPGRDAKKKEIRTGKDVEDKVFILSMEDYIKYFNLKIKDTTTKVDKTISTRPTNYLYDKDEGLEKYWLRDSGLDYDYVCIVDGNEESVFIHTAFHDEVEGIRPAIWVNIDNIDQLAETTNDNINNVLSDNVNIERAIVWKRPDGTLQIGGTPQDGWINTSDNIMFQKKTNEDAQTTLKNDKLLEIYKQYKENPTDWEVKFDDSGNLWIKRWISEFTYGELYDYQLMFKDGSIFNYMTDWEKNGNGYEYHWLKDGENIGEDEFIMIADQFRNMQDHYNDIYK